MAKIDLTSQSYKVEGDHSFMFYALHKEKNDYKARVNEIKAFNSEKKYSEDSLTNGYKFAAQLFRRENNIVLIAHSLIEAMANMFYSKYADSETFAILERSKLIEKWVTLPKLFIPSYIFQKDVKEYEILDKLIKRRNSLAHAKPKISKGNDVLQKGNLHKKTTNEYNLHLSFCSLPKGLVDNLKSHNQNAGFYLETMFSIRPDKEDPQHP